MESLGSTVRSQSSPSQTLRSHQDQFVGNQLTGLGVCAAGERFAMMLSTSTLRDEVAKERTREDSLHGVWTGTAS